MDQITFISGASCAAWHLPAADTFAGERGRPTTPWYRASPASARVARGDTMVVADIDSGAERAAGDLAQHGPGAATPAVVDARDAGAVQAPVDQTRRKYGRLDVMVNNAGSAPAARPTSCCWRTGTGSSMSTSAVSCRGARGLPGHERAAVRAHREPASLAGLLPSPGLTPYAMTRHAVVGLSLSLRAEAAGYGVGVTAVCPGVVDTPILDKGGPDDLPSRR
jgi:NAD(P)-dependent dehydrogenase (short-subunit alcohol dehydrogenase family)